MPEDVELPIDSKSGDWFPLTAYVDGIRAHVLFVNINETVKAHYGHYHYFMVWLGPGDMEFRTPALTQAEAKYKYYWMVTATTAPNF